MAGAAGCRSFDIQALSQESGPPIPGKQAERLQAAFSMDLPPSPSRPLQNPTRRAAEVSGEKRRKAKIHFPDRCSSVVEMVLVFLSPFIPVRSRLKNAFCRGHTGLGGDKAKNWWFQRPASPRPKCTVPLCHFQGFPCATFLAMAAEPLSPPDRMRTEGRHCSPLLSRWFVLPLNSVKNQKI